MCQKDRVRDVNAIGTFAAVLLILLVSGVASAQWHVAQSKSIPGWETWTEFDWGPYETFEAAKAGAEEWCKTVPALYVDPATHCKVETHPSFVTGVTGPSPDYIDPYFGDAYIPSPRAIGLLYYGVIFLRSAEGTLGYGERVKVFWPANTTDAACSLAGQVVDPVTHYDCMDPSDAYVLEPPPPPSDCDRENPTPNPSNPCNPANGNKSQREIDYSSSADGGLILARNYNSKGPYKTGQSMPAGWRHSYSRSIDESPDRRPKTIVSVAPPNEQSSFYYSAAEACTDGFDEIKANVWSGTLASATATLIAENDCEISSGGSVVAYFPVRTGGPRVSFTPPSTHKTVTRPDGSSVKFELDTGVWVNRLDGTAALVQSGGDWVFTDANNSEETFNSAGQLVSITYRNGRTETLTYNLAAAQGGDDDSDTLDKVTGPFGHTLTFAYDVNGILESVTTPDGTIEYALNADDNLASVTYADSSLRQYVYEDTDFPNHLTGIIDENDDRYATWAYDDSGRAILSEHAGGQEQVQLAYNSNGTTTMTTAGGATHTYTFATEQGHRKLSALSGDVCSTCSGGDVKNRDYDSNGYVSEETDWNDIVTKTARNARGLVETLTEAFGESEQRVTTTSWHSTYRIPTSVTTPINTTTYTHDTNGNVLTATVSGSGLTRAWTFTYNASGQVLTINGPRTDVTDVTTLTYYNCSTGSECGQLESITDALGHVTDIDSYDGAGRLTQMTEPNGLEISYTYDSRGRVLTATQTPTVGSARVTTMTYDDVGQISTVTLPNSAVLIYTYDAAHYLASIEDSLGNYINYSYDAMGNRTDEERYDPSDNLKQAIESTYDVNRRLDTVESGGFLTDVGFDLLGNLTSETEPGSAVTQHVYDALNRLDTTTDALSGVTSFAYDDHDKTTQVVAPNGATTDYVYDALENLTSESSPDRGTTTYTYDNAGNVATATDARSITATYTYDALNRLTSVSYPSSSEDVTYTYDHAASNGLGRLRSISDQSGTITYSYDEFGNVASDQRVIAGVTYTTTYEYDGANNVSSITYPSVREVTYVRNAIGEIAQATSTRDSVAKTLVSNATYEPFGAISDMTYGNSLSFDYQYGLDGRITDASSSGVLDKSYNYDTAANISDIVDGIDATKTQDFGYDVLRRLDDESPLASDYADKVMAHSPLAYWRFNETSGTTAYDSSGNGYDVPYVDSYNLGQASLTGDNDTSLRIPTQGAGYVGSVVLTGVTITAIEAWFQTDSVSNYREIIALQGSASGQVIFKHYKSSGRVFVSGGLFGSGYIISDAAVSSNEPHYAVVWYESGTNKTYMMIDGVVQQSTFTGNGLAVPNPKVYIGAFQNGATAYKRYLGNIDEVAIYNGAMTSSSFADRYPSRIEYAYDANGNRTSRDQGAGSSSLAYQANSNQLATIDSISIQHDLAGNRTSDQGGTRIFTYNDAGRLSEIFINSSSVADYVYNALGQRTKKSAASTDTVYIYDIFGNLIAEHDDQGAMIRDYVWVDRLPVAQIDQGEIFSYLHFDHLGTPRLATNDSQTVVWRWDSNAFGATEPDEDPDGNSTDVTVNFRFPGQYYDVETGLHYNYFRTYDPSTGRYLESDPIGLLGGLNTYSYVGGNPLSYFDFFGLDVDLNLLPLSDPTRPGQPAHSHVKEVTPPDGSISVSAHGNPRSMENRMGPMTPRSLSEKILTLPNYDPDAPIYLYSCETGKGDNSFAEQLKKLLPNPVIAPEEMISVDSRGNVSPAPELWRRFE